ncbi:MAG TPA: thioredoxin [Candidatus Woesebacteria bacterium]|nr:thioredoxin [Candidatus Woesebacteria bacterium]
MATVQANSNDFQKEVLEHKGIVLVDFYADWCGPCKATEPIIEELSESMKDVKFVKVDVDANQELAGKYSVFSIPTFLILKNGEVVNQFVGAQGKESFIEEINRAKV